MDVQTKALKAALTRLGYLLPGGRRQSPSVALSWGPDRLTLAAHGVGGLSGLVTLPVSASEHAGPVAVPYRSLVGMARAWPSESVSARLAEDRVTAIDTASTLKCSLPLLAPAESAFSDIVSPSNTVEGLSAAVLQVLKATKATSIYMCAGRQSLVIEASGKSAYASTVVSYSGRSFACEVSAGIVKSCQFIGTADARIGLSDGRLFISTHDASVSLPLSAESAVSEREQMLADLKSSEPWGLANESIGILSKRVRGNPKLTIKPHRKSTRALITGDGQFISDSLPGSCPAVSCGHSALRLALIACEAPTIHSDSERVYVCDSSGYIATIPLL